MFKIKVLIAIKVIWLWSFSEHTSIMPPKVCKLTFASRHPPPPRVPCAIIIHFRYCSSSSFCNHQFSFLWSCWQVLSMFCHPSGVLFCSFNKCVSSCVCMASLKFQSLSCLWHYLLVNVHLSANSRSWKMYWCDGVSYWLFFSFAVVWIHCCQILISLFKDCRCSRWIPTAVKLPESLHYDSLRWCLLNEWV